MPPKKKASAPLDLIFCAVVRGLDVDAVVPRDLDAVQLGRVARGLGDSGAVNLLVVAEEHLLHAQLLHPLALDGALDVVGGHYAREGALAARVVLLGRALAARAWILRQLERRVRRADLHEVRLVR